MSARKPELTLAQVKAIEQIERQLAELERKRRCLAREIDRDELASRPAVRKKGQVKQ